MPQIDELDTTSARVLRQRANFAHFNKRTENYTLEATDWGSYVTMTHSSARTITIPAQEDVNIGIGAGIPLARFGTGTVEIVPASGVTIYSDGDDNFIPSQFKACVVYKYDTDVWWLTGIGASGSSSGGGGSSLSTPTLTLTAISDTEITATWTNVTNEDGYTIELYSDSGYSSLVSSASKSANVTTHSFTGLTATTTYYGRVKAEGSGSYTDSSYGTDSEATQAPGTAGNINDTFTGSAGNLTGHTPEEGGAITKNWGHPGDIVLVGDGSIKVNNGAAGIIGAYTYANTMSSGNHEVTLQVKRLSGGTDTGGDILGVLLRADTTSVGGITAYDVSFHRKTDGTLAIIAGKHLNGTFSTLSGGEYPTTTFNDGIYHEVYVSVVGSTITVDVDSVNVLSLTDTSISSTANKKIGFGEYTDNTDGVGKWAFSSIVANNV